MDSTARFSFQRSLFSPTQNHLDACPLYPVQCPNMCGKMSVPREKVSYISYLLRITNSVVYNAMNDWIDRGVEYNFIVIWNSTHLLLTLYSPLK